MHTEGYSVRKLGGHQPSLSAASFTTDTLHQGDTIIIVAMSSDYRACSKTLSVEEGEPGEEAACIVMCLVSHTHVLHDTQEQYHNPLLHGYVYVYHINSVSNTFHNLGV